MITTQKIFHIHDLVFKYKFFHFFSLHFQLYYTHLFHVMRSSLFFCVVLCVSFHLFFFPHFLILASFSYLFCPHDIMLHYNVIMKSLHLDTAHYDITLDFACLMQPFLLIWKVICSGPGQNQCVQSNHLCICYCARPTYTR